MRTSPCLAAQAVQHRTPNWTALLHAVGERLAGRFMWMHEVILDDGTVVHAYKHRVTRRYLSISEEGVGYVTVRCGRLAEIRLDRAIERALLPWLVHDA